MGEAVAGDGGAIAELGGKGLHKAFAADIGGEEIVYQSVHIFKSAAAFNELLVVHGRTGDVKIIAPAGIVFRIHPVEGERNLSQDIGPERGLRPGGVDLAGGHIFYVIGKGYRHIFRPLVGRAGVDGNSLRDVRYNCNRHGSLLSKAGIGHSGWGVTTTGLAELSPLEG